MKMHSLHSQTHQQGFTVIEILVTLFVISIYIIGFFQSFILLESQRIDVARQAKASDLAYSYLRNYNSRPPDPVVTGSLLQCRQAGGSTQQALVPTINLSGQGLGGGATATIIASSQDGTTCDGTDFPNGVIKIEVTVTHSNNKKVHHATYVNQ